MFHLGKNYKIAAKDTVMTTVDSKNFVKIAIFWAEG
jgi:hypothetical protein